jgi:hypothetical protein
MKRYDIELEGDPDNGHSLHQEEIACTDGDWVKYEDHKAVVETMQNKIEELEKYKCCGNCCYWADSINGWYCTHSKKDTSNIDFRNRVCGNWMQVIGLKGIE